MSPMDKKELTSVVQAQIEQTQQVSSNVLRIKLPEIAPYIAIPHAVIISGIRRGGKSVLLRQLQKIHYPQGVHFLNFEDERLIDFTVKDFNVLHEVFIELEGEKKVFFLDEIQNIQGWEMFVRRMMDSGHKFFITGSNAVMLSPELGTRLTGRNIIIELFPYSFVEYLIFKNYDYDAKTFLVTNKKSAVKSYFNDFLFDGGMPEYLTYGDKEILSTNYKDILGDIIARYQIKEVLAFRQLSLYLFNNFATRITYNSLRKLFNITNTTTISNYVHYLENSYLVFTLTQFSYSLKQQHLLPKKLYVIDNGMAHAISKQFTENKGRYLENIVFLELKRRYKEFYYYQTKSSAEVDFIIFDRGYPLKLIQVCFHLNADKTREREIKALTEAMDEMNIHEGLILTDDESESVVLGDNKIMIKPVYEWLLEFRFSEENPQVDNTCEVVILKAFEGSKLLPCKISFEALSDHFDDEKSNPLEIFDKNRTIIEDKIIKKYRRNQLEKDGSILLKTAEDF